MDEYPPAEHPTRTPTAKTGVKQWIIEHEDRMSFLVLYVAAAVILALIISLFWLVVVVAVHFLFELIRFHNDGLGRNLTIGEALWEVKLDFALILIALALVVYIHQVLGVLGLSTAARAAGASARVVALQRAVRGILISVDDGLLAIRGVIKKFFGIGNPADPTTGEAAARDEDPGPNPDGSRLPSWRGRWNALDWTGIVIAILAVALIVAAPWLTDHGYASAMHEMWDELHPWPDDAPLSNWIESGLAWLHP